MLGAKNASYQPLNRKIFFSNDILARSQITNENNHHFSNFPIDRNYSSLYEDQTQLIQNPKSTKKQKTKNNQSNFESSPNKNLAKTRRCKSTRRNLLTCQQILDIAKKRDVNSALSLENRSSRNQKHPHKKDEQKKGKKKKTNNHNQIQKDKIEKKKREIPIQYPLSQSNSYIVFSQKDTTLENPPTLKSSKNNFLANCGNSKEKTILKAKKKNQIHIEDLNIQNQQKKAIWAATIIQKNWRGFLTRKLLQQYITSEESKLMEALSGYQSMKHKDIQDEYDRGKSSLKSMINILGIDREMGVGKKMNEVVILEGSSLFSESSIQGSNKGEEGSKESDQKQFDRKTPVLIDNNSQFLESLSQLCLENQAQSSSSSQRIDPYYQDIETGGVKFLMTMDNIQSNTYKKQSLSNLISDAHLQISDNDSSSDEVKDSGSSDNNCDNKFDNSNNCSGQCDNKCDSKEHKSDRIWLEAYIKMENCIGVEIERQIMDAKSQLMIKLKDNEIEFIEMLKIREKLNKIPQDLLQILQFTKVSLKLLHNTVRDLIKSPPYEYSTIDPSTKDQMKKYQTNSIRDILKKKCLANKSQFPNTLYQQQKPQVDKSPQSKRSSILSHIKEELVKSPISQYYTVDLPTEQLSPHKTELKPFGLNSLLEYLTSLKYEYESTWSQKIQMPSSGEIQFTQIQFTQTAFLCDILKRHSEIGAENMIERCFIQFIVDILTGRHQLLRIIKVAKWWDGHSTDISELVERLKQDEYEQEIKIFELVKKWSKQIQKWELCPIEEAPHNMEQSRETTTKKQDIDVGGLNSI